MRRKSWSVVLKDLRAAIGNSHLAKRAHPAVNLDDVEKQLEELYELYENGKIDDVEFEERKQKILSQI